LLADWRRIVERRASASIELGRAPEDLAAEPLAGIHLEVSIPEPIFEISEAIKFSYLSEVWGEQASLAVRDLVVDLCRNAFTHGGAKRFRLEVTAHRVLLIDDGTPFSISDLLKSSVPGGGVLAVKEIARSLPSLIVSHHREEAQNVVTLASAKALDEMLSTNPCAAELTAGEYFTKGAVNFVQSHPECETIYFRPEYGMLSFSHVYQLARAISAHGLTDRDIVLILAPHSAGIYKLVTEEMPNIRIVADLSI
jgi:hypothetical protein